MPRSGGFYSDLDDLTWWTLKQKKKSWGKGKEQSRANYQRKSIRKDELKIFEENMVIKNYIKCHKFSRCNIYRNNFHGWAFFSMIFIFHYLFATSSYSPCSSQNFERKTLFFKKQVFTTKKIRKLLCE